jgi:hypothetical protein
MYNVDGELIASLPLVEGKIEGKPDRNGYYDIDLTMRKEDIYRLGLNIVFMSRHDILQSKELLESMVREYNNDIKEYNKIVDKLKEQIVDCSKKEYEGECEDECDEDEDSYDDGWEYDWL